MNIELNTCKFRKLTNKKSPVWFYFGNIFDQYGKALDDEHYFCEKCFVNEMDSTKKFSKVAKYRTTTSTSNLFAHLLEVHGLQLNKKSNPITNYMGKNTNSSTLPYKQRKKILTNDIVMWFCLDLYPFEKVESKGFQRFLSKYKVIKDATDIPKARNLAIGGLNRVFFDIESKVKAKLPRETCAMAIDIWTDSCRRMKYLGVTIHFITDKLLNRLSLGTLAFPESHTAINIYSKLSELCQNYCVNIDKVYIVRDNGANMIAACNAHNLKSHSCIGHAIHNLITVDGFRNVPELMVIFNKMKEIHSCLRFRNPDIANYQEDEVNEIEVACDGDNGNEDENEIFPVDFFDIAEEVEIHADNFNDICETSQRFGQHTTLKSYCPTRCHSLLVMTESMLINSNAVNQLLGSMDRFNLILSKKDLLLMSNLQSFLSKFKTAVDILCAEKQPTINKALLLRCQLKEILSSFDDNSLEIGLLKSHMLDNFDRRFPESELIIVASILDPKFNDLKPVYDYCEMENTNRKQLIKKYFSELVGDDNEHQVTQTSEEGLLTQLARKFSAHSDAATNFDLEIDSYLISKSSRDVLEFWNERKAAWPKLYALATAILSIPATSVPVERLFSVAGLTLNKKRSQLAPDKLNKILFIHDNFDFVKHNYDDYDY